MNRFKTIGRCLHMWISAVMRRRSVRWAGLCTAVLLAMPALWVGNRLLEYRSDLQLLDELAAVEPSLGYDGASWGLTGLETIGVTKADSIVFRPNVWKVVHPVFSKVDSVFFCDIADADLERCRPLVERFSYPVELCLSGDSITDAGLATLTRFRNLRGVELVSSEAQITDAGVAQLRNLPALESLRLHCPGLTDQSILEIGRFPKLQHIVLGSVPVSVRALEALGQMKTLKSLDLRCAAFSDEAAEEMAVFKDSRPDLDIMD